MIREAYNPIVEGQDDVTVSVLIHPRKLINPATGEPLTDVHATRPDSVGDIIEQARYLYVSEWRDITPGSRANILSAIARKILEHHEELAQLECANIGKPISDARDEVALGARVFEYYAGAIGTFFGNTIPVSGGGFDFTLRQPMGVVAAVVPWNFPFPIACWKVAPALAAGNAVILKPASLSPLTALRLGELAAEAGLPAGLFQVLPGGGSDVGEAIIQHPDVRKVSFTGSTEVGRRIMQLASERIQRVSLELGGKSPNIVFADADLERAASQSPMSVFANAGQDCCARSRVFVERACYKEFVDRFVADTESLNVGDPTQAESQIGPMVSSGQRDTVEGYLKDAAASGMRPITGGDRLDSPGFFLRPAVFTDVDPTARIWREEIFGPVVCIRPFDDEATMLEEVNDTPYGLSGSIWTRDLDTALRVAKRVESGVLSINTHSSVHVEAPFGGFKQSGLGRDLGMNALEGYTELKNVYVAT